MIFLGPVMVGSSQGGMNFEEVARDNPQSIVKVPVTLVVLRCISCVLITSLLKIFQGPVMVGSSQGVMKIEEVGRDNPQSNVKVPVC